jgi:hypothetical protein
VAKELSEREKVMLLFKETYEKLLASAAPIVCAAVGHTPSNGVFLNPATQRVEPRITCKCCGAVL